MTQALTVVRVGEIEAVWFAATMAVVETVGVVMGVVVAVSVGALVVAVAVSVGGASVSVGNSVPIGVSVTWGV